jgi:hypothetical protein
MEIDKDDTILDLCASPGKKKLLFQLIIKALLNIQKKGGKSLAMLQTMQPSKSIY